jgi:ElaA protein
VSDPPPARLAVRGFAELSADELYKLLRFRQAIFVVEQRSPYPDLDGLDQSALHFLLRNEGALVGCLRLVVPGDATAPVVLGRIAVLASHRGRGLATGLVEAALRFCRERYPDHSLRLSAQCHLAHFYERFGFAAAGLPFDDFGVRHVEMRKLHP